MSSVVAIEGWKKLRAFFRQALALDGDPVHRFSIEIRTSRNSQEYAPSIVRQEGNVWTIGAILVNGNGAPGPHGEHLADAAIDAIDKQLEGYATIARQTVRIHAYAADGKTRPLTPVSDYYSVQPDQGEAEGARTPDEYSASALAKRDGVMQAVASGDVTKMSAFLVLAVMEQSDRSIAQMERMTGRLANIIESQSDTIAELQRTSLEAHRSTIAAQGEADAERVTREIQQKDDDVKRGLIMMFGKQLGRAIDLGMVKFGGIQPDDPEMKRAFLKGMLSNHPGIMEDVAEAFENGTIEPETMMPALQKWGRANPQKAMQLGERFMGLLTEIAERTP